MQKKAGSVKPNKQKLVYKPYLKGEWASALSAKRGLRILGYLLLFSVVYLFIGQILVMGTSWLRIILNLLILLALSSLLYGDGAKAGEADVSYSEIAWQRKQSGKSVSQEDLLRSYHPAKGFFTVVAGVSPAFIICLLFAFSTRESVYSLGMLPGWLESFKQRQDIGLALAYYDQRAGIQLLDILRVIVRLLIFPFINMAGADNSGGLLVMERISPLLVFIVPMAYALGYLRGPRLRAMVHGGINSNQRKRNRQKTNQRKRVKQEPKQLV